MKAIITKTVCPPDSEVHSFLKTIDFEDAYAFKAPLGPDSIEEVYIRIFNTTPKWIIYALRLRNLLVSPFGLKTDVEKNPSPTLKVGEKAGIFRIFRITENEIIAGENDKHLDFRVSVHRKNEGFSRVTVSTLVQYNNLFGRIYMTIVSPFHKMVVKSLLKNSVKRFYGKGID